MSDPARDAPASPARDPARDPVRRALAWATLVAALGFATAALAALTIDPDDALAFWVQFRRFEVVGSALSLALVAAIALLAPRRAGARLAEVAAALARRPGRLAVAATACFAAGALVVYHAHPLSMDEYVGVFQARVFAAGHLTGRLPPPLLPWLVLPVFGQLFLEVSAVTGRVVPTHWPGFAALLTPFSALGVPWLANPLLGGAALVLLARFARRTLDDDEAGGWAVLLALGSAAFVVDAMSFYSMTAHLLANLAFAALLLVPTPGRLVAAGLVGGFALTLNQPFPHFLFALPWIAWLALRPQRVRRLALLALGYLPGTLGGVLGWVALRGAIRREDAAALLRATPWTPPAANPLARFLAQVGQMLHPPTFELAWARTLGYVKLLDWAAPALLVLAWFGWRACRGRQPMGRIAASFALTVVGYWLTPPGNTQGHGWGFRYLHSVWWALPLFAAALVARSNPDRARWRPVVAAAALLGIAVAVPVHLVEVERWIARHLAQDLPVAAVPGGRELHLLDLDRGFYVQDLLQNDPFLRDPVLRARSLGHDEDRAMLREQFPGARLVAHDERGEVWALPPAKPP